MTESNDQTGSLAAKNSPDVEAAEARRIILARRAQYVALAFAASVATQACGGQSDGNDGAVGGMTPCLSMAQTGGGGMTACLNIANGGMHPCFTSAVYTGGTSASDAGGTGNVTTVGGRGGMTVCLSPGGSGGSAVTSFGAGRGGMTVCLSAGRVGSGGNAMGGNARGGMTPCLSGAYSTGGARPTGGNGGNAGNAGDAGNAGNAGNAGDAGNAGIAGRGSGGVATGGMTVCLSAPISGGTLSELTLPDVATESADRGEVARLALLTGVEEKPVDPTSPS